MTEHTIQHVSDTAFLIAECRAVESARPDALFRDPLAACLSGEKGKRALEAFPRSRFTKWLTAIRTVVIDDFIHAAVGRGIHTVVNLGAGLDTRPYRMTLPPALKWIEVDYPAMIAFKEEKLAGEVAVCDVERFALDLSDDATRRALLASLAERFPRMIVLTEGVVPYLDNEQAAALATDLRNTPGVEGWIVDFISPLTQQMHERGGVTEHMRNAPFKFRPDDWFGFFAARGWKAADVKYLAIEGKRRGRRFPLPLRLRIFLALRKPFMSRERRNEMGKFTGYVLLEPSAVRPLTQKGD
jgi:methyltransferase (TIGR00027 family)